MPKGKVALWEGPCRNADQEGEHDADVCLAGRYRGLCGPCRKKSVEEWRARGGRPAPVPRGGVNGGMDEEIRALRNRPKLSKSVEKLVPVAKKLERACEERRLAAVKVKATVREFKEALVEVQNVAQSLLNTTVIRHAAAGGDNEEGET